MRLFQLPSLKLVILRHRANCPLDDRQMQWLRDPLSHPDILLMSERDRADLQFDASRIKAN
jgi:hypothetical protein